MTKREIFKKLNSAIDDAYDLHIELQRRCNRKNNAFDHSELGAVIEGDIKGLLAKYKQMYELLTCPVRWNQKSVMPPLPLFISYNDPFNKKKLQPEELASTQIYDVKKKKLIITTKIVDSDSQLDT